MSADRDSIIAKIRALLAKTVENGCTEGEALAAAAKAAELLARYKLTVDEVHLRASPFTRTRDRFEDEAGLRLWKPASAIAELTGARYWRSRPGVYPVEITFFGFEHEVAVARYMLDICARAMRGAEQRLNADWVLVRPATRRAKVLPYLDGMADRLRRRILDMRPSVPPGKGLVVLHGALIDEEMARRGMKTEKVDARPSRDRDASYRDGRRAADRVPLSRGLAGGARPVAALR